eukprot:s826_g32.t1
MLCKELSKSLTSPLTMTGFDVAVKEGNGHGYTLTPAATWSFVPRDKNIMSWASGNIIRHVAQNAGTIEFLPGVDWQWRFQRDGIHSKLTLKKPFLVATHALTLLP